MLEGGIRSWKDFAITLFRPSSQREEGQIGQVASLLTRFIFSWRLASSLNLIACKEGGKISLLWGGSGILFRVFQY